MLRVVRLGNITILRPWCSFVCIFGLVLLPTSSIQHLTDFICIFFSFSVTTTHHLVSMLSDFVAPTDSGVYDEEVRVTKSSITPQPHPEPCYQLLGVSSTPTWSLPWPAVPPQAVHCSPWYKTWQCHDARGSRYNNIVCTTHMVFVAIVLDHVVFKPRALKYVALQLPCHSNRGGLFVSLISVVL